MTEGLFDKCKICESTQVVPLKEASLRGTQHLGYHIFCKNCWELYPVEGDE